MSGELLLALDNGTQSVRALVFDLGGNLVASARVPLVPYVSPQPGWAEQDAEYFWDSLCRATRALFAESSVRKEAI
ncbi:MAG TPA: FGGY family carbohydrate kinase, partial [Thermoanaerobaculia bacterium]|nr:FGGY family carbohydrate kinase [Thermoanaerobaculia bacterium]